MSFVTLPFVRMIGTTPGLASGESVELAPFFPSPGIFVGQSAVLELRVAVAGVISATLVNRSFVQRFTIRRDVGGVTHLTGSDTQHRFGDAAGSSWTIAVSVGVSPDRLSVIFTTGSTTVAAHVTADIYFTLIPPPAVVPSPLVEWRADYGATIASGSSTWFSRQPANTYELTSTSLQTQDITNWQNSLPSIGFLAATFGTPPNAASLLQIHPPELPLTGTSITIYMVLDYRDPSPGGSGPFEVLSIGIEDQDTGVVPQFTILINNVGGPSSNQGEIIIEDNDPHFGTPGRVESKFVFGSTANLPPSILVVQSNRNSGQNTVLNGTTLTAWQTFAIGGPIPNYQSLPYNPQVAQLAGRDYILSSVNFCIESPTYIGHVLIYNAYHDAATIAAVSASLKAFWGL